MAKTAAFAFRVSKTVSTMSRSTPPAIRAVACSPYAVRSSSKVTCLAPGSFTSAEIDAVRFIGPRIPATKRGRSGVRAVYSSAASRAILRGREVDVGHGVLDPVVGHRQPRGAEGVGLDDVGARGQVGAVDLADYVGAGEREKIVVAQQRGGVRGEVVAAKVSLGQAVPLDHGSDRAIEDQNALARQTSDLPAPTIPAAGRSHRVAIRHRSACYPFGNRHAVPGL